MTFDKQEMWQQIREESYSYTDYPDSSISQLFDEIGRLEKQVADAEARAEKAEAMVERMIEVGFDFFHGNPYTIHEKHYDELVAEWERRNDKQEE